MTRKKDDEPDLATIMLEVFRHAPWYVGPIVAAVVFCTLKWFVPWAWPLPKADDAGPQQLLWALVGGAALAGPIFAPFLSAVVLFAWGIARIIRYLDRRASLKGTTQPDVDERKLQCSAHFSADDVQQSSPAHKATGQAEKDTPTSVRMPVSSIRVTTPVVPTVEVIPPLQKTEANPTTELIDISAMNWRQFEKLLVEVLRRLGFKTEHTGRDGPDGGFDVRCMDSKGQTFLVQCKHWRKEEVGVKTVREFLGVLVHEEAASGLIVTSGLFTQEAKKFAEEKSLRLIDGENLLKVLLEVPEYRDGAKLRYRISHLESLVSSEQCPRCNSRMIRKAGRRGVFLSCERYPDCEGSRNV